MSASAREHTSRASGRGICRMAGRRERTGAPLRLPDTARAKLHYVCVGGLYHRTVRAPGVPGSRPPPRPTGRRRHRRPAGTRGRLAVRRRPDRRLDERHARGRDLRRRRRVATRGADGSALRHRRRIGQAAQARARRRRRPAAADAAHRRRACTSSTFASTQASIPAPSPTTSRCSSSRTRSRAARDSTTAPPPSSGARHWRSAGARRRPSAAGRVPGRPAPDRHRHRARRRLQRRSTATATTPRRCSARACPRAAGTRARAIRAARWSPARPGNGVVIGFTSFGGTCGQPGAPGAYVRASVAAGWLAAGGATSADRTAHAAAAQDELRAACGRSPSPRAPARAETALSRRAGDPGLAHERGRAAEEHGGREVAAARRRGSRDAPRSSATRSAGAPAAMPGRREPEAARTVTR